MWHLSPGFRKDASAKRGRPFEISRAAVKTPLLLAAYRLASAILGLTGPIYLYWRGKLGREDFSRRGERLGQPSLERPGGPLALLHAASAAQAAVLPPLVEKTRTAWLHRGFGNRQCGCRPVPRAPAASIVAPTCAARCAAIHGAISRSLAGRISSLSPARKFR